MELSTSDVACFLSLRQIESDNPWKEAKIQAHCSIGTEGVPMRFHLQCIQALEGWGVIHDGQVEAASGLQTACLCMLLILRGHKVPKSMGCEERV